MTYKVLQAKVNRFQGEGTYSVVLDEFFGYGCWSRCFKSLTKGMAKAIAKYLNSVAPENQVYQVMSDEEANNRSN